MAETNSIKTVGGGELSGGNYVGLGITGDHGSINRTIHLAVFYGNSDLLSDGFSGACGLMDGGVGFAAAAIHLKCRGAESTDDEIAVAIGGAIEIILLI